MDKDTGIDTGRSQSTTITRINWLAAHRQAVNEGNRRTTYMASFPVRAYSKSGFAYNKYPDAVDMIIIYAKRRINEITERERNGL